jgi:hypothetical protein
MLAHASGSGRPGRHSTARTWLGRWQCRKDDHYSVVTPSPPYASVSRPGSATSGTKNTRIGAVRRWSGTGIASGGATTVPRMVAAAPVANDAVRGARRRVVASGRRVVARLAHEEARPDRRLGRQRQIGRAHAVRKTPPAAGSTRMPASASSTWRFRGGAGCRRCRQPGDLRSDGAHAESQAISIDSPAARRYLDNARGPDLNGNGWSFQLFARLTNQDAFAYLGPIHYQ